MVDTPWWTQGQIKVEENTNIGFVSHQARCLFLGWLLLVVCLLKLRMAQVGPAAFLLFEQLLTQLHVAVDPEANVIVLARCYPHADVEILKI